MAATCRTQAGHLTRAVVAAANLVVTEATLRAPNRVIVAQLERCLARVRDQEHKCAQICEDIRDAQESTNAKKAHIEVSCTRDANCANTAGAQGPVGPGPAQRIICKPEKDLKPQELQSSQQI
jgi:hypothetical protein